LPKSSLAVGSPPETRSDGGRRAATGIAGHVAAADTDHVLGRLDPVSLQELDDRAALLRRVDRKYVLALDALVAVLEALADDHEVLEIDGRRRFAYRTIYFDTADLRAFHDHVADRRPRFKLRTRCYLDQRSCQFEVKIKTADDETDKRQADHPADAPEQLGEAALSLTDDALSEAGAPPVEDLRPVLSTEFERFTLAARDGDSRATCDSKLTLTRVADGRSVRIRDDRVVLETKSEDGDSLADRVLAQRGIEPVSLSKYRAGVALLVEGEPDGTPPELAELFA
jgi:hypothetical protein